MLSPANPSRMPRSAEWNPGKALLFTVTLAATGCVTLACKAAGMSRKSAYALKARDPAFAAAWEKAKCAAFARPTVEQAGPAPASLPRVTAGTRAAESLWSTSQQQAEDMLLAHLLQSRPWRAMGATRSTDAVSPALDARGGASACRRGA
jgi:hypothetical protein